MNGRHQPHIERPGDGIDVDWQAGFINQIRLLLSHQRHQRLHPARHIARHLQQAIVRVAIVHDQRRPRYNDVPRRRRNAPATGRHGHVGVIDLQPRFTVNGDRRHLLSRPDGNIHAGNIDMHGALGKRLVFPVQRQRSHWKLELKQAVSHGSCSHVGNKPVAAFLAEHVGPDPLGIVRRDPVPGYGHVEPHALHQHVDAPGKLNLGLSLARDKPVNPQSAIERRRPADKIHALERFFRRIHVIGMQRHIAGLQRNSDGWPVLSVQPHGENTREPRRAVADLQGSFSQGEMTFLRRPVDIEDGTDHRKIGIGDPQVQTGQIDLEFAIHQLPTGRLEIDIDRQSTPAAQGRNAGGIIDKRQKRCEIDVRDIRLQPRIALLIDGARQIARHFPTTQRR